MHLCVVYGSSRVKQSKKIVLGLFDHEGNCTTVLGNVGKHSLSTVHHIPDDLKTMYKVAEKLSKKHSNHTVQTAQSF